MFHLKEEFIATDDIFKSIELKVQREKRDEMLKKEKAAFKAAEEIEKKVHAAIILEAADTDTNTNDTYDYSANGKTFTGSELITLLFFYGVVENKKQGGKNVEAITSFLFLLLVLCEEVMTFGIY